MTEFRRQEEEYRRGEVGGGSLESLVWSLEEGGFNPSAYSGQAFEKGRVQVKDEVPALFGSERSE